MRSGRARGPGEAFKKVGGLGHSVGVTCTRICVARLWPVLNIVFRPLGGSRPPDPPNPGGLGGGSPPGSETNNYIYIYIYILFFVAKCLVRAPAPGFVMHGFGAGRKSLMFGVGAAPAAPKPFPKGGAQSTPPFVRVFPAAGAAQTPKFEEFWSVPKHCDYKTTSCSITGSRGSSHIMVVLVVLAQSGQPSYAFLKISRRRHFCLLRGRHPRSPGS